MDQGKVLAVTKWPEPNTVKERFLGFTNFYRRFIRNYSTIAGPLTSMLWGKPKKLLWSEQARNAFKGLKNSFTTAPILRHPDPNLSFVVEVDASSSGIGAVLSQHHGHPGKLHPCAYYSKPVGLCFSTGSKNSKADALSRQHEPLSPPLIPELILPPSIILAPIRWNLLEEIQQDHIEEPPPSSCPPSKLPAKALALNILAFAEPVS